MKPRQPDRWHNQKGARAMSVENLRKVCFENLHKLHDSGIDSKTITEAVAYSLVDFLAEEAGAFAPTAVGNICALMQERVTEAVKIDFDALRSNPQHPGWGILAEVYNKMAKEAGLR
jgi:hypothetical protein